MDNDNSFTNRLQKLLDYYSLSASGLATKIGIQRSSISHVISGRNKPSLDFVMKLLHTYNEVTIEWLIDGKGTFPKSENTPPTPQKIPQNTVENKPQNLFENLPEKTIENITPNITNKIEADKSDVNIIPELISKKNSNKEIEKIILLYKDGSFESYTN